MVEMFLDLLGVFAEFETAIRKERQLDGIAKAKAKGVYAGKGRPRKVGAEEVRKLKAEGVGPTEIAKRIGIGRASVYRALGISA
jgi:DNA invertase Pin-like site-specific DNA recombinase